MEEDVFTWLCLMAAPAQASSPLEIEVADPKVIALVLECADGSHKATVKNGVAVFDQVPKACKVNMIRTSGEIDGAGQWTCTLDGCSKNDVHHLQVTDAPGRLNIISESTLPGGSWMELACASGYRQRADIMENTAVFDAVPNEECTLFFKGGVPAKFRPVTWGTYGCRISGNTAVCSQR